MIHKKTGPDRFSYFMSPGLAKSEPAPVVMNAMRCAMFLAKGGGN